MNEELKNRIENLVEEAKGNSMVFVFGDEVYTPEEALEAMMEHADEDMEMNGLSEEEYLARQKACMAEGKHDYRIERFFACGDGTMDGEWAAVGAFSERTSDFCADMALANEIDKTENEGGYRGGRWRVVDSTEHKVVLEQSIEEYGVELRDNGEKLESFPTYEEAEEKVKLMELDDARHGCYEDGCYAIRNVITDECEIQWNGKPEVDAE